MGNGWMGFKKTKLITGVGTAGHKELTLVEVSVRFNWTAG